MAKRKKKRNNFRPWNVPVYGLGGFGFLVTFGAFFKFIGVLYLEDIFIAWVGSQGLPWFYTLGIVFASATSIYLFLQHKFTRKETKFIRQHVGMWSGFMLLYMSSAILIFQKVLTIALLRNVALVALLASVVIPYWAKTVGGK